MYNPQKSNRPRAVVQRKADGSAARATACTQRQLVRSTSSLTACQGQNSLLWKAGPDGPLSAGASLPIFKVHVEKDRFSQRRSFHEHSTHTHTNMCQHTHEGRPRSDTRWG